MSTQPYEALRAILAYFNNGGPDTPIRTSWPDGIECWEVPAEDMRSLLAKAEEAVQ